MTRYWLIVIAVVVIVNVAVAQSTLTVNVTGLSDPLLANVTALLKIHRLSENEQPLPGEARLRWLHDQAESDIQQALQPFGYYRAQINSSLQRTAEGWLAD